MFTKNPPPGPLKWRTNRDVFVILYDVQGLCVLILFVVSSSFHDTVIGEVNLC